MVYLIIAVDHYLMQSLQLFWCTKILTLMPALPELYMNYRIIYEEFIPFIQSSMPSHLFGNGIHSKGKVLLFSWIHWNWFSSGHVVRQFSSSKPSSKAKLSYYLSKRTKFYQSFKIFQFWKKDVLTTFHLNIFSTYIFTIFMKSMQLKSRASKEAPRAGSAKLPSRPFLWPLI